MLYNYTIIINQICCIRIKPVNRGGPAMDTCGTPPLVFLLQKEYFTATFLFIVKSNVSSIKQYYNWKFHVLETLIILKQSTKNDNKNAFTLSLISHSPTFWMIRLFFAQTSERKKETLWHRDTVPPEKPWTAYTATNRRTVLWMNEQ